MIKPENCGEFDNFDFPYDPTRTKFLSEGEENELTRKAIENVKKLKAEQDARKARRALENEAQNAVSISVAAPNISFMENGR